MSFIHDKLTIQKISKYQEIADRTVLENEAFTSELGKWILPNTDSNTIGMQGKEFGFDDSFAKHIHEGLLKKTRLLPDEIAGFAASGKIMMNSSSGIAILLVKEDTYDQWLTAGRAYEHISLLLLKHGIFTSIHAGMTEVDRANRMLRALLRTNYKPVVIFRIGKPLLPKDAKRPHSARPPLEDILLK